MRTRKCVPKPLSLAPTWPACDALSSKTSTNTGLNGKTVGGEQNGYGNLFLKWLVSSRFNLTLNLKGQTDTSDNSGFMVSQSSDTFAFANPDKINLSRIAQHERNILNKEFIVL